MTSSSTQVRPAYSTVSDTGWSSTSLRGRARRRRRLRERCRGRLPPRARRGAAREVDPHDVLSRPRRRRSRRRPRRRPPRGHTRHAESDLPSTSTVRERSSRSSVRQSGRDCLMSPRSVPGGRDAQPGHRARRSAERRRLRSPVLARNGRGAAGRVVDGDAGPRVVGGVVEARPAASAAPVGGPAPRRVLLVARPAAIGVAVGVAASRSPRQTGRDQRAPTARHVLGRRADATSCPAVTS